MTKTKEGVERVEDLKAQVKNLLGVDAMMDEDATKEMKETLITLAKNNGEEHIEEVIDTIEKALEKVKDPEFKAMIGSIIWTKCPMGMQKSCIEMHNKMLRGAMVAHMEKQTGGDPLVGLALLAATMESKLKNERNQGECQHYTTRWCDVDPS